MRFIFLIILSLFFTQVRAEITSSEDFSKWMMYYYKNPEPSTIIPNIKKASEFKELKDTKKSGPPLFGFISGLVKNNPGLAPKMASELSSIDESLYGVILVGIWYANLPESENIVSNELDGRPLLKEKYSYLSDDPVDLLTLSPKKGPWVLDAMWGYFAATGSDEPILKIISVLPYIDESKKQEILSMGKPGLYLMATSGAAQWSLTSNSKQHSRVLEICQNQISKQPEPISTQLKEIVSKATQ